MRRIKALKVLQHGKIPTDITTQQAQRSLTSSTGSQVSQGNLEVLESGLFHEGMRRHGAKGPLGLSDTRIRAGQTDSVGTELTAAALHDPQIDRHRETYSSPLKGILARTQCRSAITQGPPSLPSSSLPSFSLSRHTLFPVALALPSLSHTRRALTPVALSLRSRSHSRRSLTLVPLSLPSLSLSGALSLSSLSRSRRAHSTVALSLLCALTPVALSLPPRSHLPSLFPLPTRCSPLPTRCSPLRAAPPSLRAAPPSLRAAPPYALLSSPYALLPPPYALRPLPTRSFPLPTRCSPLPTRCSPLRAAPPSLRAAAPDRRVAFP
ncbi:unnamed protein product [Closterium sp. Yama58-4]|nr:unnamed protein product [Closterium sp. Yama58-4]